MRDELIAALERFVPEAMRVTATPGLTVALALDGEPIWEAGFGFADLAAGREMTPATTFRTGSFSKLYVAVATMQLVEQGALALHEPVRPRLPELDIVNPLGEREVTVYDLLTHRSGLATDSVDAHLGEPPPLREHLSRALASGEVREYGVGAPRWTAKVGDRYQYSTLGPAVLGHLVERVAEEPFADYVRRRIFEPLGMRSSGFPDTERQSTYDAGLVERLATGYARFGRVHVPSPALYSADSPSAGLITTAGDHLRLLLAIAGDDSAILGSRARRAMLTPQSRMAEFVPDASWQVGLIVEMSRLGEPEFNAGHGGAHPWGWWSDGRAYPRQRFAIVVCTNCWDMMRYHNPADAIAPGLIADFVSARIDRGGGAARGWSWERSYAMGAMMVERIRGLLGVPEELDDGALQAMIEGARALGAGDDWDAAGFRGGVADMAANVASPEAIRAFLDSPGCGIGRGDEAVLALGFGRRGGLPLPMRFWADAGTITEPPPARRTSGPGRR